MTDRVVVVGAGVIGLACAVALQHRGFDVTVVEAASIGAGASTGNAGWLVPSLSTPMPGPGMVLAGLKALKSADGPFYVHRDRLLRDAPWFFRFLLASRPRKQLAGLLATEHLARRAFPLFEEWGARGLGVLPQRSSMLYVSGSRDAAQASLDALKPLTKLGYALPRDVMTGPELRAIEPVLSEAARAGFVVDGDGWLDPTELLHALHKLVVGNGGDVVEENGVEVLQVERNRVRGVRLEDGTQLPAPHVVVACGAWTHLLLRQLRLPLPLAAGKGYSYSVELEAQPSHMIYLLDAKAGVSPLAGGTRIAGTMEFAGLDTVVDERRVASLALTSERYLRRRSSARTDVWAGLRPMIADGLPAIGAYDDMQGLYLATGHGMLGVTLALPTAEIIADAVSNQPGPVGARCFSPQRFVGSLNRQRFR